MNSILDFGDEMIPYAFFGWRDGTILFHYIAQNIKASHLESQGEGLGG
jgi:hypothetical protein